MSSNPFAEPAAASGGITWSDHLGALVLIEPAAYETGIVTAHGETDAVRADVYVLDGPNAGAEFPDCLVFPRKLVGQLRPRIGEKVLGRVGQGEKQPGKNPPWQIVAATPQDIQTGTAWLNQRQGQSFAPPAPAPAGQPAGQQWQQEPQGTGQVPF